MTTIDEQHGVEKLDTKIESLGTLTCPRCNVLASTKFKFCTNCRLKLIVCPNPYCKLMTSPTYNVCQDCGHNLRVHEDTPSEVNQVDIVNEKIRITNKT